MKNYVKRVDLTKSDEFLISSMAQYFSENNFSNISFEGKGNAALLKSEGPDAFVKRYMALANKLANKTFQEQEIEEKQETRNKNSTALTLELTHDEAMYLCSLVLPASDALKNIEKKYNTISKNKLRRLMPEKDFLFYNRNESYLNSILVPIINYWEKYNDI